MLKFNADDDIEWKTFIGGNASGDLAQARGVAHKLEGQVYMAGFTTSASMLHQQPGSEFYQTTANAGLQKGFIARLNKGTGARQWSSYFGNDSTFIYGMVGLGSDKLLIVGSTTSAIPQLDVQPPAGSTYWPYSSLRDGFVSMFGNGDRHVWRTHLPGNAADLATDVDARGTSIVVAGITQSTNLNLVPYGSSSYTSGPLGEMDCFLYEFSSDGLALWGTHVGTEAFDWNYDNGISIDPSTNDIVIVGSSTGGAVSDLVPGTGWYQENASATTYPGFVAKFSGMNRSRIWHTHVFDAVGTVNRLMSCAFDQNGNLIVGGFVDQGSGSLPAGPSLLSQALPGLYEQPAINIDHIGPWIYHHDALLLIFSPANDLLHGTYFGGEGGAEDEIIWTVLRRNSNGNVYFAGRTSKAPGNPTSYFPLDDGGGAPYFEELWQGASTEGFIASLCGGPLNQVGLNENSAEGSRLTAFWSSNHITVFGLPPGQRSFQIVDAIGRTVSKGESLGGGTSLNLGLPSLAEGTYLFITGVGSARFAVIR
jgi:hypothetical protein